MYLGSHSVGFSPSARFTSRLRSVSRRRSSRIVWSISAARARSKSMTWPHGVWPLSRRATTPRISPRVSPTRLGRADEAQAVEHVVVELPVPRGRPRRRVVKPDVLVVAQRRGRHARASGDLTDEHDLTFQCAGTLTVLVCRSRSFTCLGCPNLALARERLQEALELDATAHTDCPTCGQPITIAIIGGVPHPAEAVLWLPAAAHGNLIANFCARADVYCSPEHLHQAIDTTRTPGDATDLDTAASLGREVWADVVALDLAEATS